LIDEFLAKSGQGRCHDLKETAEVIAKVIPLYSLIYIETVTTNSWKENFDLI
jgi:hypothetical protein